MLVLACGDGEADDANLFQDPEEGTFGVTGLPGSSTSMPPLDTGVATEAGGGTTTSVDPSVSGPDSSDGPSDSTSTGSEDETSTGSSDDRGSTDEGSSSEGGSSGGGMCGPEAPGMGACPVECTGGCAGGTCTILCGVAECAGGGSIDCPADWPCFIDCNADNSCSNTTINCDNGPCTLECGGINSCLNSTMNCGPEACSATCMGPAGSLSNFNCAACSCMNNGC